MTQTAKERDIHQTLERLLEEHGPWLRRAVRRACPRGLNIQPEEIEQEVRLRLWKILESESEVHSPASYLYRVVNTATIDAIRRVKARREDPLVTPNEDPMNPLALDPATADPDPEMAASDSQAGRLIVDCLERLQENRRAAVKLYLQGFNYQEVADLLEWSEAKARNLVSRGMKNLREQLESSGVNRE